MNNQKENIKFDSICDLLKNCENDDGTFANSLYNLYFFIGLTKGVDDMNNNRGTTLEDLQKEREELYERYHRRYG